MTLRRLRLAIANILLEIAGAVYGPAKAIAPEDTKRAARRTGLGPAWTRGPDPTDHTICGTEPDNN